VTDGLLVAFIASVPTLEASLFRLPLQSKLQLCSIKSVVCPERELLRFVSEEFRKIIRFNVTMRMALFPKTGHDQTLLSIVFSRREQESDPSFFKRHMCKECFPRY